jgi:hypothetical protein
VIYQCGQAARRELVLATAGLNGIDYLEVLGPPGCGTQLAITFLKDATGLTLGPGNITLGGGAPVSVTAVTPAAAPDPDVVTVTLGQTGDFARYTLALVAVPGTTDLAPDPPDGLDPALSAVSFSFKAGCPSPADCLCAGGCPCDHCQPQPALPAPPDINYLARDYDGLRQVILDRLAVLTPAWTERHAADLGIVLSEVLAYAADHLSYQQDAAGTEAYLGTARSRISLRRHARLVDYRIGEGASARVLVAVTTTADGTVASGTLFYPAVPGLPAAGTSDSALARQLSASGPAFTAIRDCPLAAEQNAIELYTWGDGDCCLPAGATSATLTGNLASLGPGTVLVLEEVLGPATGVPGDADPAHRHAVLLTAVRSADYRGHPLADPVTGTPVTQVSWADADALPFPLTVSATVAGLLVTGISVARGNIVLADQGVTVSAEQLPAVPAPGRYYPQLAQSPLTFAVPFTPPASAAAFLSPDPGTAAAALTLADSEGTTWEPAADLLSSAPADTRFVPEVDSAGTAFLRFGDGQHGALADPGLTFTATYRVGNGSTGNVSADALGHAVFAAAPSFPVQAISRVRNPLPATSGTDPETSGHIRQFAPFAFQQQARCVTEDDYGQQAGLVPGVSAARGTLRWTGSWYSAFVSVEPAEAAGATTLAAAVATDMGRLRMLGTDVAVEDAVVVGLRITLAVCVADGHFRGDVYTALLTRFTGPGGIFAPANFTFGQTVYASPLIAAAQAVEGVASVTLAAFARQDAPWSDGTAQGYLTLGRLEIPRCDNDPDHLDHGFFTLVLDGGK